MSILLALKVEDVFLLSKFLIHSNLIGILKIFPFVFKTLLFSLVFKKNQIINRIYKNYIIIFIIKKFTFLIEIFF